VVSYPFVEIGHCSQYAILSYLIQEQCRTCLVFWMSLGPGTRRKLATFWREQPFVALPDVNDIRPKSYHELSDATVLAGKKIGVPKMYIGGHDSEAIPVHTRKSVIGLWKNAKAVLEPLGATAEEVDFPVVTNFEKSQRCTRFIWKHCTSPS
jgi:hypothetical protein